MSPNEPGLMSRSVFSCAKRVRGNILEYLAPHRETLSEPSGQAGFDDRLLGGG